MTNIAPFMGRKPCPSITKTAICAGFEDGRSALDVSESFFRYAEITTLKIDLRSMGPEKTSGGSEPAGRLSRASE